MKQKNMSQPTFLINEIFPSIEGETSFQGQLMLFVRFTGCNLRCKYCDTTYAYSEGESYTLTKLLDKINSYNLNIIHLTGGEPLIQKNILELIENLSKNNKKILIETNGSVDIYPFLHKNTHLMVDVKTPGSGEEESFLITNLKHLRKQDELKFVITNQLDYEFSKNFIAKYNLINKGFTINFSPAITEIEPNLLAKWIVDDGLTIRFNLQIHKYIWPNIEKGV